jgi:hypothetical protein
MRITLEMDSGRSTPNTFMFMNKLFSTNTSSDDIVPTITENRYAIEWVSYLMYFMPNPEKYPINLLITTIISEPSTILVILDLINDLKSPHIATTSVFVASVGMYMAIPQ